MDIMCVCMYVCMCKVRFCLRNIVEDSVMARETVAEVGPTKWKEGIRTVD